MPNIDQIIIRKEYFDNIKTSIDSLNSFFSSNFKNKNFPVIDSDIQIDGTLLNIFSWLNSVEPSWIDNSEKVDSVLEAINDAVEGYDSDNLYSHLVDTNNTVVLDHINAFVGYKVLQFIADNFTEFSKFINAIYTFELFTKPSQFKDVIQLFSQPVPLSELDNVMGDTIYTLFDVKKYVAGVFGNDQIKLPNNLKHDTEISRIENFTDLNNVEIVIDESIQEAAEINYFEDTKPEHIKYDVKTNKFKLSKQLQKFISDFITDLYKCDTTEDLTELFSNKKAEKYPDTIMTSTVMPFILAKVFNNEKKFPYESFDQGALAHYIKSYKSIADKNPGAKRFINYDLFSTFKTDKEGTVHFIEDFLFLELYNNEAGYITNNKLLTLFNIFDSRIYLDILYNLIPEDVKKDKYPTEDGFVKEIRARINKNSRAANVYKTDNKASEGNEAPTSEAVQEYVGIELKEYGDMSISDMMYNEHYHSLLQDEINCLGDRMYNTGTSQIQIDSYVSESYNTIQESYIQEQEMGDIPDYMRNRIKLSDETGNSPDVTVTDIQLPPDVPTNPVDDLCTSIDARMNAGGGLDDMLGAGYNDNPHKNNQDGKIVYNITNNYHNSFNRDSSTHNHTVNNDLSTGKTTTTTNTNSHNDSSTNKRINKNTPSRNNRYTTNSNNNNNNGNSPVDTKDSDNVIREYDQMFTSGYTIDEVFTFLESEDPLSMGKGAGKPPKGDLLTTAMDADRATLAVQQGAKKRVQKGVNTVRAILKPVARTKQWLTKMVDSLIKRDEDKVKAEIIESPSYRTALYKASRLAIKFGLTGIAFTISGYLGAAYLVIQGAKVADKQRLRKEVQEEFATELEILNDKIRKADEEDTPESRKAKWQMMRLRSKMEHTVAISPRERVKSSYSVI